MKVKIQLVFRMVDWVSGDIYTVTDDPNGKSIIYPSCELSNKGPLECAKELFEQCVKLHKEWANIYLSSAELDGDTLNLFYNVEVPLDSEFIKPTIKVLSNND